ncbi:MAG TPA: hypothetical protein VEY11_00375 [Pyrinomonadaceae bacterium]|nr:hypothetical protein [Pyrinomonadaceae bacterium]
MNIEHNVLMQSLVNSTLENMTADYKSQGFEVYRDHLIEGHIADFVAVKGDKMVIYEIKSGPWNEDKRRAVAQLREYVSKLPHGEFKLYFIGPPRKKSIEIEDLDRKLVEALIEEDKFGSQAAGMAYDDVMHLASWVTVDGISDFEIDDITIRKSVTEVTGTGFLEVNMQYGSDGDVEKGMGMVAKEAFPMTFKLLLDLEGEIKSIEELDVDISSFTE